MSRLAEAEQAAADRTYVEPDPRDTIITELMEALEPLANAVQTDRESRVINCPVFGDIAAARSALSRARSLMEQKP